MGVQWHFVYRQSSNTRMPSLMRTKRRFRQSRADRITGYIGGHTVRRAANDEPSSRRQAEEAFGIVLRGLDKVVRLCSIAEALNLAGIHLFPVANAEAAADFALHPRQFRR